MVPVMTGYLNEIFDVINMGDNGYYFNDTSINLFSQYIQIQGEICFNQAYKDIALQDKYKIQILFPFDYPKKIPIVSELENRIPSSADSHNNKNGDGFCLGVPGDIYAKIYKNSTFKYFISEIVIPFLYANTFYEKYKKYPWPTRPHFGAGLIEYYQTLFNLKNEELTKKFLYNIAFSKEIVKGHTQCPCGSGKKFRNCHRPLYTTLITFHSHKNIQKDVLHILKDDNIPDFDNLIKEKIYTKKWYKLYRTCLMQIIRHKK